MLLSSALLVLATATAGLRAQTSPAAPAPATVAGTTLATAAPQSKPLLILRPDGVKAIALRARSASVGANLLVETLDGSARTLPASAYINQLAWYTDAELESGRVDLTALAIRYRAFGGLYPEVRATLYAEAQKFRDIAERLRNASARQSADTQKRVADVLAAHFDPEKNTSREEIAAIVREGDELTRLLPAQAEQITQAATPFRDALAKLDAGQVFYDGKWLPDAEAQALRKQREDTAIQQTFDKTLALPLEPLALGLGQLIQALALPAVVLLVLLITGLAMLLGKRRGPGVLLVALALAGAGLGYSTLTQNNSGGLIIPSPDAPETVAASSRLVRLLYQASGTTATPLPAEDRNVRLTSADLSSFLARHVQPKEGSDTSGGLRRDGLALGIAADGFVIVERVTAAGQTVYLRYDARLDATRAEPGVREYTVRAGGLTLPGPIKDWLWARLVPSLGKYVTDHHLLDTYALTDMARGETSLTAARPVTGTGGPPLPVATPAP